MEIKILSQLVALYQYYFLIESSKVPQLVPCLEANKLHISKPGAKIFVHSKKTSRF